MKRLLFLFTTLLLISCSSDDNDLVSGDNSSNTTIDNTPKITGYEYLLRKVFQNKYTNSGESRGITYNKYNNHKQYNGTQIAEMYHHLSLDTLTIDFNVNCRFHLYGGGMDYSDELDDEYFLLINYINFINLDSCNNAGLTSHHTNHPKVPYFDSNLSENEINSLFSNESRFYKIAFDSLRVFQIRESNSSLDYNLNEEVSFSKAWTYGDIKNNCNNSICDNHYGSFENKYKVIKIDTLYN